MYELSQTLECGTIIQINSFVIKTLFMYYKNKSFDMYLYCAKPTFSETSIQVWEVGSGALVRTAILGTKLVQIHSRLQTLTVPVAHRQHPLIVLQHGNRECWSRPLTGILQEVQHYQKSISTLDCTQLPHPLMYAYYYRRLNHKTSSSLWNQSYFVAILYLY